MHFAPRSWIVRLRVGTFAIVAGLSSFALVFREAQSVLGLGGPIVNGLAPLAVFTFLVVSGLYTAKILLGWAQVRAEFSDPVTMQFFPTLTISALMLPLVVQPYVPALTTPVWLLAAGAHLALMISMVRCWIVDTFRVGTFSPVWFLSVGGNLVAAMTGAQLGFSEPAWFFLTTGLLTCGAMFAIAMYRLIFHDRIPDTLAPSLFILMTPPSAAFLAYMHLGDGQLDVLARLLFFSALFVAAVLVSLAPVFLRVRFSLGWWACTFPSGALAMAALRYYQAMQSNASLILALVILAVAVFLFSATCWRSVVWLLKQCLSYPRTANGGPGPRNIRTRDSAWAGRTE